MAQAAKSPASHHENPSLIPDYYEYMRELW